MEHTIKEIPMNIDNLNCQMSFVFSDEAGKLLAFLADKNFNGAINGSSNGTISIYEIIDYDENKTGKKAVIDISGENAPYNCEPEYSINTDKANAAGFKFSSLHDRIYDLLDHYLDCVVKNVECSENRNLGGK